jgi:hypothetical protein
MLATHLTSMNDSPSSPDRSDWYLTSRTTAPSHPGRPDKSRDHETAPTPQEVEDARARLLALDPAQLPEGPDPEAWFMAATEPGGQSPSWPRSGSAPHRARPAGQAHVPAQTNPPETLGP